MGRIADKLFDPRRVSAYVAWICRRRVWVLAAAVMLTAIGGAVGSGIQLDTDIVGLLPRDTPSVQRLDRVLEKTGGFGDLMVMIESPALDASIAYARDLLPHVERLEWVEDARYGVDTSVFERNRLLYMDLGDLETIRDRVQTYIREQKVRHSPFFVDVGEEPPPRLDLADIEAKYASFAQGRDLFASDDGTKLILVVQPSALTSDIATARRVLAELRELVARHPPQSADVRVSIGGTYRNRVDEYRTVVHDVKSSGLWASIGVALLLVIYFRSVRLAVVAVVPLLMSLAWTLAVTRVVIGRLNLMTVFLVVVLLGLGIDFGIHLLSRYASERGAGADVRAALVAMVRRTGRATLTAGLTTAAAFFTLTFSDFLGFSQFGFIAGTGILLALSAYLLVLPSLLAAAHAWKLLPAPRPTPASAPQPLDRGDLTWLETPARRRRVLLGTLAAAFGVTVGAAALAPGVGFEQDLTNLRARLPETREFNRKMRDVFDRPRDPAVVLVRDAEEAQRLESWMSRHLVRPPDSPVAEVRSLASLLPAQQNEKLAVIASIERSLEREREAIPEEERARLAELERLLDVSPVRVDDLPSAVKRPFIGLPDTPGQLVVIFQRYSLLDLRYAVPFYEAVRALETPFGTFYPVSEPLLYVQLLLLLARDAVVAVFLAAAAIAVMVLADLWSVRGSGLVIITLGAGVIWMLGAMRLVGLDLNVFNLVVVPSIIGIGVDTAVHLYHRFLEDSGAGIGAMLRQSGGAAAVSSGTTMIGFGGLIAAEHPGLRSIGLLAVIGVAACFLAAVSLVPALFPALGSRMRARADGRRS